MSVPLILASSSPRRIELLRACGISFEVFPSLAEELHDHAMRADDLCATNALRKAREVASRHPHALVLGADTLVTLNGRHFGKPQDLAEAHQMLRELSGQTHQVVTGVALLHLGTGQEDVFAECTEVKFRQLSVEDIAEYVRRVPVLDKAGAYAIQEHGQMIIAEIRGSYTNVIGLPVEPLLDALVSCEVITPRERDKIAASPKWRRPET